ncbi:MAG: isopentenyl phosphate kinase [Candidatus Micrarchaeia archaeon]
MKLLKLGGSVITNKKGRCEANLQNIKKLAKMLAKVWKSGVKDIVLVHGAGSFGHALVIEHKLNEGVKTEQQKKSAKEVQVACAKLSQMLQDQLREEGVDVQKLAPHELIKSNNKRIVKFDKKLMFEALKNGKMPILHGDMVPDEKLGISVCSGDQMIAYLASEAEFVVLGTDVDGILAGEKVIERIEESNFEEIKKHIKESGSPDVTGGMLGKINEMRKAGGTYYIVNANFAKRVENILNGKKDICTKIEF